MMTGKKKGGLASRKKKQQTVKVICFCVLCLCSLTVIMPLWFMVSTGLKSMDEIFFSTSLPSRGAWIEKIGRASCRERV